MTFSQWMIAISCPISKVRAQHYAAWSSGMSPEDFMKSPGIFEIPPPTPPTPKDVTNGNV